MKRKKPASKWTVTIGKRPKRAPVMRTMNPLTRELKGVDTGFSTTTVAAGAVTLLNGVVAGDDINERNGRKIALKYLDMFISFNLNLATLTSRVSFVRYMVVYDNGPNGIIGLPTDILSSPVTVYSTRRLDTMSRFSILLDQVHSISGLPPTDVAAGGVFKHHRVNLKNMPVTFTSALGGIGAIREGSLYLLVLAESISSVVTVNTKCIYVDV